MNPHGVTNPSPYDWWYRELQLLVLCGSHVNLTFSSALTVTKQTHSSGELVHLQSSRAQLGIQCAFSTLQLLWFDSEFQTLSLYPFPLPTLRDSHLLRPIFTNETGISLLLKTPGFQHPAFPQSPRVSSNKSSEGISWQSCICLLTWRGAGRTGRVWQIILLHVPAFPREEQKRWRELLQLRAQHSPFAFSANPPVATSPGVGAGPTLERLFLMKHNCREDSKPNPLSHKKYGRCESASPRSAAVEMIPLPASPFSEA